MSFDRNIDPYRKLNEVVEQLNMHTVQLNAMQEMLTEIQQDRSLWGMITRLAFRKWLNSNGQFQSLRLREIDIPPVRKELEIDGTGRSPSSGKRHYRGSAQVDD